MADPEDIKFKLTTEGDAKGAEKVREAIKQTGEEAKKVNEETRQAAEQEAKVNDAEMNMRGRAVEFVKLGESVRKYAEAANKAVGEMDHLDESTKKLAETAAEATGKIGDAISTIAQGFAAGGPIGALISSAGVAFGVILDKVRETDKAMDSAEDSGKRAEEMWRKLQELKKKLPIIEMLEAANTLLDEQYAKFVRNEQVAKADRGLAQDKGISAVNDEVSSGSIAANAGAAKTSAIEADAAVKEVQQQLQQARLEIAKMGTDAGALEAEAMRGGANQEKLQAQAIALKDKQREAALDFIAKQAASYVEIQGIYAKAGTAIKDAGKKGEAEIYKAAQDVSEQIDKAVAAEGKNATAAAKGIAEAIHKMLADGILTADEVGRFNEQIKRMNGLQERNFPAVAGSLEKAITMLNSQFEIIKPLEARIRDLENKYGGLRSSYTDFGPPQP